MTTPAHLPGCTGKVRYVSRKAARTASKRSRRYYGRKLHVYECDFCDNWHLSSHHVSREAARERNRKLLGSLAVEQVEPIPRPHDSTTPSRLEQEDGGGPA